MLCFHHQLIPFYSDFFPADFRLYFQRLLLQSHSNWVFDSIFDSGFECCTDRWVSGQARRRPISGRKRYSLKEFCCHVHQGPVFTSTLRLTYPFDVSLIKFAMNCHKAASRILTLVKLSHQSILK